MKEIYLSCEGRNNGQISGPPRRNGLKRTRPTHYAFITLCGLRHWQHGALYSSGHDQSAVTYIEISYVLHLELLQAEWVS